MDIIDTISKFIVELNKRNDNSIGIKQCLDLLQTSKKRIQKKQQSPEMEARSLYQTLASISTFENVKFTDKENDLYKDIKSFAHSKGVWGEINSLNASNSWRKPF
ncbi:Uncharacterised protein [Chlamydia trachomatis]|nr:Uncharacterised protein [Chlamydia trachomatis]